MAEQQIESSAFSGVTVEGNEFAALLNKEFKLFSEKIAEAATSSVCYIMVIGDNCI